jgi:transcriptional regulator with XRE-family HTH domain
MFIVESWSDYVRRVSKGLTQEQISEVTGISQTTVSSWLRSAPSTPKAEMVIALARAFRQPPIEALAAAGYLTAAEAASTAHTPLGVYSSGELFDELRRRNPD